MTLFRFISFSMLLLFFICFCSEKSMNREILLHAIDIAKKNSINSRRLNWPSIEKEIFQQASHLSSEKDLYRVLQTLINRLEDKHSYLLTAEGKRWLKTNGTNKNPTKRQLPLSKLRNAKIAYIKVNPMPSALKFNMNTYAERLQSLIITSYKVDMTGWILDFRENTGGQLWPMLAGLSPLINSDIAGYAVYPNGNYWQWWAKMGKAGVGKNIHHQIKSANNQLIQKKPTAILISKKTASSGEACVISFIGTDNICFIGEQTRGLATVNQPFKLANGAILMLTTAYFGDRNKKIYPDGIEPDIKVDNDTENEGDNDIQLNTAIEWLKHHKEVIGNKL